jgi:hypothetical protein
MSRYRVVKSRWNGDHREELVLYFDAEGFRFSQADIGPIATFTMLNKDGDVVGVGAVNDFDYIQRVEELQPSWVPSRLAQAPDTMAA